MPDLRSEIADSVLGPHCAAPIPVSASVCSACGRDVSEHVTLDTPAVKSGASPTLRSAASRRPSAALESLAAGSPVLDEGLEIGQRYRIVRLLGRGGMGAVYQVRDLELSRDVALKLIRPEIAADRPVIERFKREIELSSR